MQAIIDATPTNGVANLAGANYLGNTLTVNRAMTVRGGYLRSTTSDRTPVVHVIADRVVLHNLRIDAVGNRPGVRFEGNFGQVSGCNITGAFAGIIAARTATHCIFSANRITGGRDNGIYLSSARHCVVTDNIVWDYQGHSGIKVRGWGNVIANNVIYEVPIGITVSGVNGSEFPEFGWRNKVNGFGNIVDGNTIDRTRQYGVFMDTNNGWLWGTRITNNVVTNAVQQNIARSGIRVFGPLTTCTGNLISRVSPQAIGAIDGYEADYSFITHNQITNSRRGIVVDPARSVDPVLSPNIVLGG